MSQKISRRAALRGMGMASVTGAALAASSGCGPIAQRFTKPLASAPHASAPTLPLAHGGDALRFLNRAAWGPAPGDLARVEKMGRDIWLDQQLTAPTGDDDEDLGLRFRLRGIEVLHANAYDTLDLPQEEVLRQLQQAAILRAAYSHWQLRERMADFWTNHFNIYARKGLGTFLKATDDLTVVHANALGSFPAMLKASAKSPAMLGYLDNNQNQKGVANENYAREIMELHTLGVGSGYTQKDIQEVARCLTGWTVEDRFLHRRGSFRFDADRHDDGPKTVLGVRIPAGGGESDGDRVLDILANHPWTEQFISRKLVRYFLGEENPVWVARTAETYQKTHGDIGAMLRPLLLSDDLLHAPPILKRPFDFMVSSLRATSSDTDGGKEIQAHLAQMGQPLFLWPMPDGYPDKTASWTGSLLARWNFALALAGGSIGRIATPVAALLPEGATGDAATSALIEAVLGTRADDAQLAPLRKTLAASADDPAQTVALLLASPPFQWR